jgi:hypothetical protein
MSSYHKFLFILLSLILLWLSGLAARVGIANLRYSAGEHFYTAAIQSEDAQKSRDLLKRAYSAMKIANTLDSGNSSYQLQSARISFALDRLLSPDTMPGLFYPQAKMHLASGLKRSPTRADLWTEYAKISFEKEGATRDTLVALDRALKFGPKESPTLMVNAAVTLYFWGELDPDRQKEAWMLVLDAMEDWRLAKEINKIARQTGWYKQLQRSLRER